MAVGLILAFPGHGESDYEAVNKQLGIDMKSGTGDWPSGLLTHAAGTDENGDLVVMEVWESREAQGRFMQERLGPAVAAAGVTGTPQIKWLGLLAAHSPGRAF